MMDISHSSFNPIPKLSSSMKSINHMQTSKHSSLKISSKTSIAKFPSLEGVAELISRMMKQALSSLTKQSMHLIPLRLMSNQKMFINLSPTIKHNIAHNITIPMVSISLNQTTICFKIYIFVRPLMIIKKRWL